MNQVVETHNGMSAREDGAMLCCKTFIVECSENLY